LLSEKRGDFRRDWPRPNLRTCNIYRLHNRRLLNEQANTNLFCNGRFLDWHRSSDSSSAKSALSPHKSRIYFGPLAQMPRENPPSASNSSGAVSSGSHFWQMAEVCKRGECELAPALRLIYEWQIRWPSSIFGEIATQTRGLAVRQVVLETSQQNPALDRFGAAKTKFVYVATQKICQSMNQN
jgi:hypothetical protein